MTLPLLVRAGLIRFGAGSTDPEATFEHALIQEAAYRSLLRAERRSLHRIVAGVLEGKPDRSAELLPVLAGHYDRAGDVEPSRRYYLEAGRAAAQRFASAEARQLLDRARELTGAAPIQAAELLEIYAALGEILETVSDYPGAIAAYEELHRLGETRGESQVTLAALMALAKVRATPNPEQDPGAAADLLEQALRLARARGDRPSESRVLWNRMILAVYGGGEIDGAIRDGEQALALARSLDLQEQTAFTLNDLGYAYTAADRYTEALDSLRSAATAWRDLDNPTMLADSLAASVPPSHALGRLTEGVAAADESLQVAQTIDNVWGMANSRFWVSHVHLDLGRPDEAIRTLEEGLAWAAVAGHVVFEYVGSADLGWIRGSLGDTPGGLALARGVLERVPPVFERLVVPHVRGIVSRLLLRRGEVELARETLEVGLARLPRQGLRLLGPSHLALASAEMHLARGAPQEALATLRDHLREVEATGAIVHVPETLALTSTALRRLERHPEALEAAERGLRTARSIGLLRVNGPLWMEVARSHAALGETSLATDARAEARGAFEQIITRIPEPEFQRSFRSLEWVQAAFET